MEVKWQGVLKVCSPNNGMNRTKKIFPKREWVSQMTRFDLGNAETQQNEWQELITLTDKLNFDIIAVYDVSLNQSEC